MKPVLDFGGTTVNERLSVTKQFDAFDAAARGRDRAAMVAILARVEVGPATADAILADPSRYGY